METNSQFIHNFEMEKDVISACIFDQNIFYYVRDMIHKELFACYECIKAYEAIRQLDDEGKTPNYLDVDMILRKDKVSASYFITENHHTFELTKQHVLILQDLSIRRRLSALMYKGMNMVSDPMIQMGDIQKLSQEFDSIICNGAGDNVTTFGEVIENLMNNIAERMKGNDDVGFMTGLRIFDSRFGWHGGDFIIFAGAPSAGKSTLATTISYNLASRGIPVAYYSMEMSSQQLASRIVAKSTQVSARTSLYDRLSDVEYQKIYDGTLEMKHLPIYFDENSKISFMTICQSIRRLVKKVGLKVVFLDYLQILANGRGDNREAMLGDMARDLKRLAVEHNICIVALSQLNRSGDREKEPTLANMRGSGQIEEACDIAVLIQRPKKDNERVNIYLAKGRNIGTGKDTVKFNTTYSYFSDYEQGDPSAPFIDKKEKLPF